MRQRALPENVTALRGCTPSFLTAPGVDPESLTPLMYELDRLSRDIKLARKMASDALDAGVPVRPDLIPFLQMMAGQFAYRAGQVEADVAEAQGLGGAA